MTDGLPLLRLTVLLEVEPTGNVHWIVPRAVNNLFTGRIELLERIKTALLSDDIHHAKEQKRFVITGLGGQGKSEVCLKAASLMREEYVLFDLRPIHMLRSN